MDNGAKARIIAQAAALVAAELSHYLKGEGVRFAHLKRWRFALEEAGQKADDGIEEQVEEAEELNNSLSARPALVDIPTPPIVSADYVRRNNAPFHRLPVADEKPAALASAVFCFRS